MASKLAEVTNTDASAEDVAAQMIELRNDVADLTKLLGQLAKGKGDDVTEAVQEKAKELRDAAKSHAAAASEQTAALQNQANDFIKSQPAAALGIAAGLGFLVGFMSSRK
jgi:ElaB/YqjD/DUF883 family membrane-anchored ribosome-binding protein